jgi:NAD(P)-dependent dehydrogenase (short-subunit alcohol dehydrogenase family)
MSDVAIVTGGASGLGAEIARGLAKRGDRVVIADIDAAPGQAIADEVGGVFAQCDVRLTHDVAAMVEQAASLGELRTVVLSAAVETRASVVDCTDDDWRAVLDTNLAGPFRCLRATLPVLVANGGGAVVALGSTLGQMTTHRYAAYCASKTALNNLCKQAAIEHAPEGVRVNVVAPSATDSGLFIQVTAQAPDPEALRRQVAASVPMRRLGRAEDVVAAVLFLTGPDSTYISGTVLAVDGGLAARRMS